MSDFVTISKLNSLIITHSVLDNNYKINTLTAESDNKNKKLSLKDLTNQEGKILKELLNSSSNRPLDQTVYNAKKKHVVLIGGGMSAERQVSFMSCDGIANSLIELGYGLTFVDMGEDIAQVLQELNPDVVFNGLHGTYGEDGCLPGLLDIMKIPYTSCGLLTSSICFNKKRTLDAFKSNNIKVAESILIKESDGVKIDPMMRPYVIKPLSEGSSVGVEVIFEEDEFDFVNYEFEHGDILVEKYIKGREIQVAVLNGKALGTLEIVLLKGKRFYDYETKYTAGFAEHICPANLTENAVKRAMDIAEKITNIMDASGMVRVELIYSDAEDDFYALEINTHPGFTPLSICPEIAQKQCGISYTELVESILLEAKFC